MAVNSARFASVVNPDEGIYVEMVGIMEVKCKAPTFLDALESLAFKLSVSG